MSSVTPAQSKNALRSKTIVIDGEIGAGKSTLLSAVAKALADRGFKVCVISEPVDSWREVGILDRFYKDPNRYTYEFQTYTFTTRILKTQKCVKDMPDADIYLLERSILTDRYVFMELLKDVVGEQTMKMYDTWCHMWEQLMPLDLAKATYLYLKPDIEICMGRVEKRGRYEELQKDSSPKNDESSPKSNEPSSKGDDSPVPSELRQQSCSHSESDKSSTVSDTDSDCANENTSAKGGVSVDYQRKLRIAHERFLEGKHIIAGKDTLPKRPFPLSSVVVAEGRLANGDFTLGGKDYATSMVEILKMLKLDAGVSSQGRAQAL